jgi:hypothetical protein
MLVVVYRNLTHDLPNNAQEFTHFCVVSMAVMIRTVDWWVMTQRNESVTQCHNLDVRITNAANSAATFGDQRIVTT